MFEIKSVSLRLSDDQLHVFQLGMVAVVAGKADNALTFLKFEVFPVPVELPNVEEEITLVILEFKASQMRSSRAIALLNVPHLVRVKLLRRHFQAIGRVIGRFTLLEPKVEELVIIPWQLIGIR